MLVGLISLFAAGILPPDFGECCFAVTGVRSDDVLNVREEPDYRTSKVGELNPDAAGVIVDRCVNRSGNDVSSAWLEQARSGAPERGIWCRIAQPGLPGNVILNGWVNAQYLEYQREQTLHASVPTSGPGRVEPVDIHEGENVRPEEGPLYWPTDSGGELFVHAAPEASAQQIGQFPEDQRAIRVNRCVDPNSNTVTTMWRVSKKYRTNTVSAWCEVVARVDTETLSGWVDGDRLERYLIGEAGEEIDCGLDENAGRCDLETIAIEQAAAGSALTARAGSVRINQLDTPLGTAIIVITGLIASFVFIGSPFVQKPLIALFQSGAVIWALVAIAVAGVGGILALGITSLGSGSRLHEYRKLYCVTSAYRTVQEPSIAQAARFGVLDAEVRRLVLRLERDQRTMEARLSELRRELPSAERTGVERDARRIGGAIGARYRGYQMEPLLFAGAAHGGRALPGFYSEAFSSCENFARQPTNR